MGSAAAVAAVDVARASQALNTALRRNQPKAATLKQLLKSLEQALHTSLASAQAALDKRHTVR